MKNVRTIAILALAFTGLSTAAFAEPSAALRSACMSDAMRLCSQFVPDVERITACMIKQRIRLSPPCRAVFTAPPKAKSFKHSS